MARPPARPRSHRSLRAAIAGQAALCPAAPPGTGRRRRLSRPRGLDRALFQALTAGRWIEEAQNLIINPAGDPPPRPTSIGTAGRLRSEQVADINRNARPTSSESATIRAKYELPTGVTAPHTYVYHC